MASALEMEACSPDWDRLFEIALGQAGHFTTRQAAEAGYSPQLITHHMKAGRMIRVLRGVYRLVHFPAGEHEELAAIWLWSEREGVFSHMTALALHDLSDALPAQLHITLPEAWRKRRLRVPEGVVVHYGDIGDSERGWFGPAPVTAPLRTLKDCAASHVAPELLRAGALDALARGLVERCELDEIEKALEAFGGIGR